MKTIKSSLYLIIWVLMIATGYGQGQGTPDEMAIHQIVQDMQDGWNTKSGEKFASHFAADHSYVVWNGLYMAHADPVTNAQIHQGLFYGVYKSMYLNMKVDNIRFVKPDVAMVHVLLNTWEGDEKAPNFPTHLITMLMVKNGNIWEITSFHNLNIEYVELLRKAEPAAEEIAAFSKENYPRWYK